MKKEIQQQLTDLENMVKDLLQNQASDALEEVQEIKSKIEDKMKQLQQQASGLKDKTLDFKQEVEQQTKQNPLPMLCGAAAIGVILGLIIRRD